MPRYLIIGIDPGHTVGVAALELSGRLLHTAHLQAGGLSGAISLIESWGTPSLIATDVRPAPEMALKLAASFNVPLFVPERPWREDDKKQALKEMVEKASLSGQAPAGSRSSYFAQNAHERDALSAAIAAWRHEQNLLRKADGENLPPGQSDRFKHLLLQGYRHDFALQKIMDEQAEPAAPASAFQHQPSPASKAPAAPVSPHLSSLERANAELRKRVSFLEHEREGLFHRIRLLENGVTGSLLHDRTLRTLQAQIARLQLTVRQTHARVLKQKEKPSRPSIKPAHLAPAHSQTPAPLAPARPPRPATATADPPSLKEADEKSVLEKLLSEYRRGRRS